MKIFIIIIILFFSLNIQAKNEKKTFEYETAMSSLKNIPRQIAKEGTKKISGKNTFKSKNFKNVKNNTLKNQNILNNNKNIFDTWGFNPNPIIIRNTVRELSEDYPKEVEIMKSWPCPDDVKKDNYLKDLSIEEKCLAYMMRCNAKIISNKNNIISTGSGFFIKPTILITNNHVILDKQSNISILPFGHSEKYIGKVIASDEINDFLAIDIGYPSIPKMYNFPICEIALNKPNINVDVIAIGSPENKMFNLTKGKLTKYLTQNFIEVNNEENIIHWIEMTADITYGSSGGPLYYNHKVIGVNTGSYNNNNISIYYSKLNKFLKDNNLFN